MTKTNPMGLMSLDPLYIVGFTDGEGQFMVWKNPKRSVPLLRYAVDNTDENIIRSIYQYFGVGHVYAEQRKNPKHKTKYRFAVSARSDLAKIIEFFDKYPLRVKMADYIIFRLAYFRLLGQGGKQPKLSCDCGPFEFNNKKEYKEHIDNGIHELEMNSKIAMQWVEDRDYSP